MSKEPIYCELVKARLSNTTTWYKATKPIIHGGTKGTVREYFVHSLLRPFLPPDMEIGQGHAINSAGLQSKQIDVIIYDRSIVPPIFIENMGFVPCESILATIEVKSVLDSAALQDGIKNGISVKELRLPNLIKASAYIQTTPSFVFAFDTTIKAPYVEWIVDQIQAQYDIDEKETGSPYNLPISGVCIWGKSFIHSSTVQIENDARTQIVWHEFLQTEPANHEAFLRFIYILIQAAKGISAQRKEAWLFPYLIPKEPSDTHHCMEGPSWYNTKL